MTAPSTNPVRLAALVAGCLGVLVIVTIAFVDGPDPSHGYRHLVSVHDSLIPTHTAVSPTESRPRLEGQASVREEDLTFSTWMFRWRGRWASVHRVDRLLEMPPQSRVLERSQPERFTFDLGDLSIVAWQEAARTWVIAGSDDARSLVDLSALVLDEGIESLSRSPSPQRPGPSLGDAPASAPAPQ